MRVAWGPLAEPLHTGAAGAGDPPWRENAFFSFWDEARTVAGAFHVSTSPNAGGSARPRQRRDRRGVSRAGRAPRAHAALRRARRGRPRRARPGRRTRAARRPPGTPPASDPPTTAAFCPHSTIFRRSPIGSRAPTSQDGSRSMARASTSTDRAFATARGATATSPACLSNTSPPACASTPSTSRWSNNSMPPGQPRPAATRSPTPRRAVVTLDLTRSAAGLAHALTLTLDDGERLDLTIGRKPRILGADGTRARRPTLSAYDEFVPVAAGPHGNGFGSFEHGILRRLT